MIIKWQALLPVESAVQRALSIVEQHARNRPLSLNPGFPPMLKAVKKESEIGQPLNLIIDRLPAEQQARIETRYQEMRQEVEGLRELRTIAGKAQADIAAALNIKQPSVSKIEKQTDMYLSTLRRGSWRPIGDCATMARLAIEAMASGALGFATSRTINHRASDGTLIPTLTAAEQELTAIADALGTTGHPAFPGLREDKVARDVVLDRDCGSVAVGEGHETLSPGSIELGDCRPICVIYRHILCCRTRT